MDSKYEKNKFARTHEEARMCVCCCCGRKVKIQKGKTLIKVVDEKTQGLVVKFVFSDFSISNPSHPTSICTTCRLTLSAMEKVVYFLNFRHLT